MASSEATNGVGGAEEQPTSSTSTSISVPSQEETEKLINLAANHLAQGKRHLVVKDFQTAMDSLGEACRILSENDQKFSRLENAESHFFYGKALLEQSRIDMGVLEGADLARPEEASDEESEEEKSEEEDDSEEAEATNNEATKSEDDVESSEATANGTVEEDVSKSTSSIPQESAVTSTDEAGKSVTTEQDVDLNAPSPTVTSAQVVDNEVPCSSSGLLAEAAAEKQAEEELSNLELAWEVLEVAKIGYRSLLKEISVSKSAADKKTEGELKTMAEKETHLKKRLADTHCSLGEVATESENYNQAIDEFKTGLEILSEIEGSDSREIAQYYFQMGLAYSFDKKFPAAIDSFKKSVEIIETRIGILKDKIENKQTAKDLGIELEDPSKTEADEVQELTALLPELQEKITDTIDAEKESQALEEEEKQEKEIILRNSPLKNPNPPAANDISHLVKKKKKADDAPIDERPVKKICTDLDAAAPSQLDAEMKDQSEAAAKEQAQASTTNGHPITIDA